MNLVQKAALLRLLKSVGITVVSVAIGWLSGPDVANVFGTQWAVVLGAVAIPVLHSVEVWLQANGAAPPAA